MSAPETKVSCKYGAPMGRGSDSLADFAGCKVRLRRVRLNGDYDQDSAYWGASMPLWFAECDKGTACAYLRAASRNAAKMLILAQTARARFYR